MAQPAAEIEDRLGRKAWQVLLDPLGHRLTAAVIEPAERPARGGEQAGIVIGRPGDVAALQLGMIAAGHAVMVHSGEIARHVEAGGQLQPFVAFGERQRFGVQRLGLAQRHPAARLLALLHGGAAKRRPDLKGRVFEQRPAHLVAVLERAVVLFERWLNALFEGGLHARQNLARQMAVHVRQEIKAFGFVMADLRKHPMPAYQAIVRRPVIGAGPARAGGGFVLGHGANLLNAQGRAIGGLMAF